MGALPLDRSLFDCSLPVLIVEDEAPGLILQHFLKRDGMQVCLARTHEGRFAFITMDGHLGPKTTEDLVMEFRRSFHGPMIAASSREGSNEWLLRAGCSVGCCKVDLIDYLCAGPDPDEPHFLVKERARSVSFPVAHPV